MKSRGDGGGDGQDPMELAPPPPLDFGEPILPVRVTVSSHGSWCPHKGRSSPCHLCPGSQARACWVTEDK